MSFAYIQKIPEAKDIRDAIPVPDDLSKIKEGRDREISAIATGASGKFLLVIGPCSAHDEDAVCEYVSRLGSLQGDVEDKIVLVPRIYTNKPRTTGLGYKGMMHQPNPLEKPNIVEGIKAIRKMHIRALRESGLSAADEMLYPGNYPYLEDILSYVAIGARSVENQQHRLTVSGLDIPVGMKNPTSGDMEVMLNSVKAAQSPHVFSYNGWEVRTSGNPLAHCILRGAVNKYGQNLPNYHYEDLMRIAETYIERAYANPTIIVDTNHSNSNKAYKDQPRIALEVVGSMKQSRTLKEMVKGLMIESFIEEGSQDASENVFGKSITDPCLGWEDTKELVLNLASVL